MNIVFYDSLPYWAILIILLIFLVFSFLVLKKNPGKRKQFSLLLTLRGLALTILLLFFFKPAIQFIEQKDYLPEIPVYIDPSFSMLQDISINNKPQSRLSYVQQLYNQYLQSNSNKEEATKEKQIHFRLYQWKDKSAEEIDQVNQINTDIGIFDLKEWTNFLNSSLNLSASAVVLFTDLNLIYKKEWFKDLKQRIYIPILDNFSQDIYIKSIDAKLNNRYYNLSLEYGNQFEKTIMADFSIYHSKRLIYKQKIHLKSGLNLTNLRLRKRFKKNTVLKAVLKSEINENNALNNEYYFTIIGKEAEKTIHLYFEKPSYNLSFLRQFLKRQSFYYNSLNLAKHGGKLKIGRVSSKDCLIFGNVDSLDRISVNRVKTFTQRGGLTIFLKGASNIASLYRSSASQILPFTLRRNFIRNNLNQNKHSLKLTRHGQRYPFLNFREPKIAQDIWNDLAFFTIPEYQYSPKKKSYILATIKDSPAIILTQYGRGYFVSILTDSLWKIDFQNLSYGIQSQNYDQFWDELINLRETRKSQVEIDISDKVIEFGKKITVNFPVESFNGDNSYYIQTKKNTIIPLKLRKKEGIFTSTLKTNALGRNIIYQKNNNSKPTYLGDFFVNYPLWESIDLSSKEKTQIMKDITLKSKGRVIYIRDLNKLDGKYFRLEQERFKIVADTSKNRQSSFILHSIFLLILITLFTLEWYLKKFVFKL